MMKTCTYGERIDPTAAIERVHAKWEKAKKDLEEAQYIEHLIFLDYVKTIKSQKTAIVLLYYRRPYENERELICTCESEKVALEERHRLMEEWPDAYPSYERFEINLIRYVRRAY